MGLSALAPRSIGQWPIFSLWNKSISMWFNKKPKYSESEEYLKKQQDIDTVLVLSKLLDPTVVDSGLMRLAADKIKTIVERIK